MDCSIEENTSGILQSLKTNPKLLRCKPIMVFVVIMSNPENGLKQFSFRFYRERAILYLVHIYIMNKP